MPVLNREAIFAALPKLKQEDVDCPEWGGSVRVRELTAAQREEMQILMTKAGFGDNGNQEWRRGMNARLVIMAAIDENGQAIFEMDDQTVKQLSASSGDTVLNLAQKVQEISGLFPTEKKKIDPAADLQSPAGPIIGHDGNGDARQDAVQ
jgi:hypothetical protein